MNDIKKKLMNKAPTFSVIGLYYVGIPLALEKAKA